MFDSSPVNEDEIAILAALHRQSLPDSALSWLGEGYLRAFYRYVQRSNLEAVVVQRDEAGKIVAAAVIAWQSAKLLRRLLLRTPMAGFLVLRAPWVAVRLYHRRRALAKAGSTAPTLAPNEVTQAPEVVDFYTAPGHRGRGSGTALLLQCERFLGDLGERRYWLKTEDAAGNRAIDFYRRNGFAPAGNLVASGVRFVVLAKDLDDFDFAFAVDSDRAS